VRAIFISACILLSKTMKKFLLFPLFFRIFSFSLISVSILISPSSLLAQKLDKFFLQYEANYNKFSADKYLHSPVKDKNCSSCHTSLKEVKKLIAKGNALCYTCHKELEKEIKTKKVHGLLQSAECLTCHNVHSGDNPALLSDMGKDCTTCHDPKDKSTAKAHFGIFVKKGTCNSCHQAHTSSKDKLLIETGHPMFLEKGCDSCHAPTPADGKSQLSAKGEKLCFTCHGSIEDLGKKKNVHAVFSDCLFCHSAHVAKEKKLLDKKMNNVCYDCHLENAFREHPVPKHPVYLTPLFQKGGVNCLSCHNPHASDNKKMLNDKGKDCTNCHNLKEKKILSAHSQIVVKKDACAKCHTLRKPVSQHPDFAKNNCSACHPKSPKEGKVELLKKGNELCFLCHQQIKADLGKKFPHGIVKDGECSTCHEVHSSAQRSLLNATGNDCATCHDLTDLKKTHFDILTKKESCRKCHQAHGSDKEKILLEKGHPFIYDKSCDPCHRKTTPEGKYSLNAKDEKLCLMCHADIEDLLKKNFVHQVAGECTVCHLAHLSQENKLLLKNGEALCADCHQKVEGHPVSQHPISGSIDPRFSKEKKPLTCLSCHNPHGADFDGLVFADRSRGELCQSCHKK